MDEVGHLQMSVVYVTESKEADKQSFQCLFWSGCAYHRLEFVRTQLGLLKEKRA